MYHKNDHFLLYQLDWENEEITLLDASSTLRDCLGFERAPMTSVVRAMIQILAQQQTEELVRLHVDVDYTETSVKIRLCADDCLCHATSVDNLRVAQVLDGLLSPRELEIAAALFEGRTIRYIAADLQIAEGTVKRTMHNIYRKLGVASQVELIRTIYVRACG